MATSHKSAFKIETDNSPVLGSRKILSLYTTNHSREWAESRLLMSGTWRSCIDPAYYPLTGNKDRNALGHDLQGLTSPFITSSRVRSTKTTYRRLGFSVLSLLTPTKGLLRNLNSGQGVLCPVSNLFPPPLSYYQKLHMPGPEAILHQYMCCGVKYLSTCFLHAYLLTNFQMRRN